MVHSNLLVILEENEPFLGVGVERIVENEVGLWSVELNHLPDFSVEVGEDLQVSVEPWLIDWLVTEEGGVGTVSLQE